MVALAVLGLASSALLLASQAALVSADDAEERTVAIGLANQLIDEALGLAYMEKGQSPTHLPLGRESGEWTWPPQRAVFDDVDDYHNYVAYPCRDAWGAFLGQGDGTGSLRHPHFRLPDSHFQSWLVYVTVRYANESDPSQDLYGSQTSGLRAIQVRVYRLTGRTARDLADVRRVYAYVPPPS